MWENIGNESVIASKSYQVSLLYPFKIWSFSPLHEFVKLPKKSQEKSNALSKLSQNF